MTKTLPSKLSHLFMIFLGFLSACSPITSQAITPTVDAEVSPTATLIPTSTSIPTPAHNIVELSSASQPPLPEYKRECINILRPNPELLKRTLQDLATEGVAIFSDYMNDRETIVFLDLRSGEKRTIPEDSRPTDWAESPEISPDGKWLFYLTAKEDDLMGQASFVLSNSQGIEVKKLPVSTVQYHGFFINLYMIG